MGRTRKAPANKSPSNNAIGKRKASESAAGPTPDSTSAEVDTAPTTSTKRTSTRRAVTTTTSSSTNNHPIDIQAQLADRERALANAQRQIEELKGEFLLLLSRTMCGTLSDGSLTTAASMQNHSTANTTSQNMASSSHLAGLSLTDDDSDGLEELPAGSGVAPHASSSGNRNSTLVLYSILDNCSDRLNFSLEHAS
jgi:hypothetical protein